MWSSQILLLMNYYLSLFRFTAPLLIQIDSSTVNLARDEAFAKVQVELRNVNHPKPLIKMKVDTGAQGNILNFPVYRNMFPEHVDDDSIPTGTTHTQTKLTAYNGTTVPQHGVCSIK